MVFSNITFLFYFLPITLISYYITPYKFKNLTLLLFSLVFYSWGEPIYILIMFISIFNDYINSKIIEKYRGSIKAKIALISSISINLGLLVFFKYTNFFISIYSNIFSTNYNLLNITLPIGISFYTFQTMSYTIDVYKNKASAQKSIIPFATFTTLFPQLVAGPIVRYCDINKDLNSRIHNIDKIYNGVCRFIFGLGKKVIIANNLGLVWTSIKLTSYSDLSMASAWLGAICFFLQIYFDFSGYSDMAIGLGKLFGFNFLENFNYPYISKSITEFWSRWHISLGIWFRDYLYIPLGGNRLGKFRWILNIFIVWFLTGLWHGANINFIIWGIYFGIILMIEKLFFLNILKKYPYIFRHAYVLFILIISFILFDMTNLNDFYNYINALFNFSCFLDNSFYYYFTPNVVLLIIAIFASTPIFNIILIKHNYLRIISLIIIFLISVSYLVDSTYNPFLYFRF